MPRVWQEINAQRLLSQLWQDAGARTLPDMTALILLGIVLAVAVAGGLWFGTDSRDPAYSLRLRPYDPMPPIRHLARRARRTV
jgi:hypothetical protein